MQQPAVADLVKRISQDLQGKSSSAEVTFRKGANELRHKHAQAMFSYTPDNDDELRLEKDDVVEVLGEEEEGWWRGRLLKSKDKEGVFPNNFVRLIDDQDAILSKSEEKTKSTEQDSSAPAVPQEMIQPKKIQGIGFGNIFAGENKIELRRSCLGDTRKVDGSGMKDGKVTSNGRTTLELNQKSQEYAKVAFPYEAENDDELTLKEGDVILILSKKCEDPGWWKGELNGREGVFPDNFVELLTTEEVEKFKKSGGAVVSPPIIPAKPTKLVGPVRPVSPPSTTTTSAETTTATAPPHAKHAPERPLPPTQPPAKIPATVGTVKTVSPSSIEQKDKSPTGSENDKTPDNKPSTPKKTFTASLSSLIAKGRPPVPGQQTSASGATPPSSLDEKPIHKNVDERDAIAPLDSERLTHPTALRPRNPNKRPPSQAFLKDSIAPSADSPTHLDLSALSPDANVRNSQTAHKEKVTANQISNDRETAEVSYVTKEEFDNLKREFDQFRKECAEKIQSLENLLSTKNSNK